MKSLPRLLLAALLLPLGLAQAADNLITNGSFEEGLKDWSKADPSVFEVTTGPAAEGKNYIALQVPAAKEYTMRRTVGGLTAGQEYTLAVKTRKNTITDLRLVMRDPVKKAYVGFLKLLPSDDWSLGKKSFKAPGAEVVIEISARTIGSCDLDDVILVAGNGADLAAAKPTAPGAMPAEKTPATEATDEAKKEPFIEQITAFESFDKVNPPKPGAVLFVGSSSIKRWTTIGKYFPDKTVINRGFGGSKMKDVVYYADRIVLPVKAGHILVYAGDNDLAAKGTPEQLLADFQAFVGKVRAGQPDVPITFIAVKPSPKREMFATKVAEANKIIAEYIKTDKTLAFVDNTKTVLGPDGKPDPSLYAADTLHLNEEGYKRWAVPIQERVAAVK